MTDAEASDEPRSAPPAGPVSLYRRYRPERFAEVVGQDALTTAMRNAVGEARVGHAYLFSGPRGTGKTTTARLLAKTLNCLDRGDDTEPCGTCENCRSIAAGEFYDLIELDAASNRGVDAIRDLIHNVNVGLGASSLRKVYVIDEVHMLTTDASNALLKTLEEPPGHVVFVLATTEPGKVLPTIRSRTQHFELRLLDHAEIVGHLGTVLDAEGVAADPDALDLIARRAAGSVRDALSLLDQALALGDGAVDEGRVRQAFGDTPLGTRVALLDAIGRADAPAALETLSTSFGAGADPRRLLDDLVRTARDAFVLGASKGAVLPPETSTADVDALSGLADRLGAARLTRVIDRLGTTIVDVRGPAAPDPRLLVEVAVVRLATPATEAGSSAGSGDDLMARVVELERRVAALAAGPSASPRPDATPREQKSSDRPGAKPALGAALGSVATAPTDADAPAAFPKDGAAATDPDPEGATSDDPPFSATLDQVVGAWPTALDTLSTPVRSQVDVAQPIAVEADVILFGAPAVHVKRINAKFRENADAIKGALRAALGGTPKLKVVADETFSNLPEVVATSTAAPAAPAAEKPAAEPPPDEGVDLSEFVRERGDAPPVDSTTRLVETFDATVVEERSTGG